MTQDEFMAIDGRERDALVASSVMGWVHQPHYSFEWAESEDAKTGFLCPPFTTDIAAAWEVVEKLKGPPIEFGHPSNWEWAIELTWIEEGGTDDGWYAIVKGQDATADTAPLAICIAALRAMGEIE